MEKKPPSQLEVMNERSREIFRQIVETYLDTGSPVGSRSLSKGLAQNLDITLSSASIRNVMSDLEEAGLLNSPHTSAGRLPSQLGLRLFIDGLLEVGDIGNSERNQIEALVAGKGRKLEEVLSEATAALSGLSHCASVVVTPKHEGRIRHIEFSRIGSDSAMAIMVFEDGNIENRLLTLPAGTPTSALVRAANYLNARLCDRSLGEARTDILSEIDTQQVELDRLSTEVIRLGLAEWSEGGPGDRSLIVRGQSNLLEDLNASEDLERIRTLFDDIEQKRDLLELLDLAEGSDGVRIFIGSETQLFSLSGSSVVVSPYMDSEQKILGVVGVIGPTRLNYARIIPMVDFTAKTIGKILG